MRDRRDTRTAAGHRDLDPLEFGARLLETLDLDPVYVAIHRAGFPVRQRKRLLLAYWCFYDLGVAGNLSSLTGDGYWEEFAYLERHGPRGRERRHFRGGGSREAVAWLAGTYGKPEAAIDFLCEGESRVDFASFSDRIRSWPMFGPWIAFKAADMLTQLEMFEVVLAPSHLGFYREPASAAALAAACLPGYDGNPDLAEVVDFMVGQLRVAGHAAPPARARPCGIYEVETILCKWKGYRNGRYHIGEDVRGLVAALGREPRSLATGEMAARFDGAVREAQSAAS